MHGKRGNVRILEETDESAKVYTREEWNAEQERRAAEAANVKEAPASKEKGSKKLPDLPPEEDKEEAEEVSTFGSAAPKAKPKAKPKGKK